MLLKHNFSPQISLTASNGKIIVNSSQIKVLGVYLKTKNLMITNLRIAKGRAMSLLFKIMPLVNALDLMQKKRILISLLVLSILKYCSVLYVGQTQEILSLFHVAVM